MSFSGLWAQAGPRQVSVPTGDTETGGGRGGGAMRSGKPNYQPHMTKRASKLYVLRMGAATSIKGTETVRTAFQTQRLRLCEQFSEV